MRPGTFRQCVCLHVLLTACHFPRSGSAQSVIVGHERLASDRPEARAMHDVLSGRLMTSFGASPTLAAGDWQVGVELGRIPRLSGSQQRVGFGEGKAEDLHESPLFGRVHWQHWRPHGPRRPYCPSLQIDGARAHDLFAVGRGRRVVEHGNGSLSTRLYGQHGRARGDIGCPAGVAGPFDPVSNPFGCVAESNDRIELNYYGLDLTVALQRSAWPWHATFGLVRSEPDVQMDALVFTLRDRSRLVALGRA